MVMAQKLPDHSSYLALIFRFRTASDLIQRNAARAISADAHPTQEQRMTLSVGVVDHLAWFVIGLALIAYARPIWVARGRRNRLAGPGSCLWQREGRALAPAVHRSAYRPVG